LQRKFYKFNHPALSRIKIKGVFRNEDTFKKLFNSSASVSLAVLRASFDFGFEILDLNSAIRNPHSAIGRRFLARQPGRLRYNLSTYQTATESILKIIFRIQSERRIG
jgi:hypothetical protein